MKHTPRPARAIFIGHLLAALSVASIFSAMAAFSLRPFYHGRFEGGGANDSVGWVRYFDFEVMTIDYGTMLAAFVFLFLIVPFFIAIWLSRHNPEPQFGRWYGIVAFGGLLFVGLTLNLFIGLLYALAGFNSTEPF